MIGPTRHIGAGTFMQGDDHHYPEESPARLVHVAAFVIDAHPVTNAQFAEFVDATGHVTAAERDGSAVFVPASAPVDLARSELWWRDEPKATWRRPLGTDLLDRELADHPVVAVTVFDARAFASWRGGRLPTESEWEWAAGAGGTLPDTWPLAADGRLLANVWLGEFPWLSIRNRTPGTMPVGAFPPNPNGLFDMLGHVWELTDDDWCVPTPGTACCAPAESSSATGWAVAKGGSYLCAANYCRRYRPAARHRQAAGQAACHIGFRCAYDLGTAPRNGGTDG